MDKHQAISDLLKSDAANRDNGGFWNSPVTKINKETKELLEVLLNESRLTLLQKQHIRTSIKNGEHHLPINLPKRKTGKSATFHLKSASSPDSFAKGLRSRQSIISSGCYARAHYQTDNYLQKDSSVEKERLQNLLIYDQETAPENVNDVEILFNKSTETPQDAIAQLEIEIEERQKFLEDMKRLGKDKKYKSIILTEISQRKRQIAALNFNSSTQK
ncbi:hypothetical protein CHUAL_011861 [Chamberlinius hualienensis]